MRQILDFIRDLRERGLEFVSGRYLAKYQGKVAANVDPQGQARIKVVCGEATGGRTDEIRQWAYPTTQFAGRNYGLYLPPEVGDAVWVWFDHGDVTQPRYSGQWWTNPTKEKKPATSYVPVEFQPEQDKPPTTRGCKTRQGHGWLFEDDETRGRRAEFWTGEPDPEDTAAELKPAIRRNELVMSDQDLEVRLHTYGVEGDSEGDPRRQHQLRMKDSDGARFGEWRTIGKDKDHYHRVRMDDSERKIQIRSSEDHFIEIDDENKKLTITSATGFSFVIDQQNKKITVTTADGRTFLLDDENSVTELATPNRQTFLQDDEETILEDLDHDINITTEKKLTATSTEDMSLATEAALTIESGQDARIEVGGNEVHSISGNNNENIDGSKTLRANSFEMQVSTALKAQAATLLMDIDSTIEINGTSIKVNGPVVTVGSGPHFALVNELFFSAAYSAHTHTTTVPGAPTGPPITGFALPSHQTMHTRAS